MTTVADPQPGHLPDFLARVKERTETALLYVGGLTDLARQTLQQLRKGPLERTLLTAQFDQIGFRSLSMSPAAIGPVKAMLLEMNVAELSAMIHDELKHAGGGETLRPKLAHFAETHGIPV